MARLVFSRWAALVAAEIRGIVTLYPKSSANDEFIECVTKKFAQSMRIFTNMTKISPHKNPKRVAAAKSAPTNDAIGYPVWPRPGVTCNKVRAPKPS